MYVVAKEPDNPESWDKVFFQYPEQIDVAVKAINTYSPSHEIYIAPALFKSKSALKENVWGTNVLWADFDGNTPNQFDIPPSLIVRSSEPGHEHVYWRLDQPLHDIDKIEEYNRRLTFKYEADNSGWDANQVLRPPTTKNHKRNGLPVGILQQEEGLQFNIAIFEDLVPAPAKNVDYSMWAKMTLPSLNDVIYSHKFGPDFRAVFEKSKDEVTDRSAALSNLAFICAETGLDDKEIFVVISNAAERWEKFKHHRPNDRTKNLLGIIEYVRIKVPKETTTGFDEVFEYSPLSLLNSDLKVEWAIPGMLMKNGIMVLTGPSGIGKTQFSMQFMAHLAVGKPFLNYEIDAPQKVIFFSLEMGDVELKAFMQSFYPGWVNEFTPEELDLLNKNLVILPFGEPLPLNLPLGQEVFLTFLNKHKPDGIFIDSMGSAIAGNSSDLNIVQPFTAFNDRVRKRHNLFLWYVHHFRKPPPGQKHTGGQADSYGDQSLISRATSNYTMLKAKNNTIRVKNPKNRHAPEQKDYLIQRKEHLTFEYMGIDDTPDVVNIVKKTEHKIAEDNSPTPFE